MKAGLSTEPASKLKELSALADEQYNAASQATVSDVSPLLVESQTNFLKSLRLFAQAADRHIAEGDRTSASDLIVLIGKDAYYKQAVEHALLAQAEYYNAMLKWGASLHSDIPEEYIADNLLELDDWRTQSLIVKNKLIAEQLHARRLLTDYYPQDLTARIDQFISSGQAANMKIKTISPIIDLLLGTDAVRSGDFNANKERFYKGELLPQLPFFIS